MVQFFTFSRSVVTSVGTVPTEGSAIGFHVGGDATYFFDSSASADSRDMAARRRASMSQCLSGNRT
jgi:hypothetical protein